MRATIRHSYTVSSKFSSQPSPTFPNRAVVPAGHVMYATAVTSSTTSSTTLSSIDNSNKLPDNIQSMINDAVQAKLGATNISQNDNNNTSTNPDHTKSMIDEAIATKLDQFPSSQISQIDVDSLVNKAVDDKFSSYDNRLTNLEEPPVPKVPSTESITTLIKNGVQKELKPISARVSTTENSLGVHTSLPPLKNLTNLFATLKRKRQSVHPVAIMATSKLSKNICHIF